MGELMLAVRVQPRARRSEIAGERAGALLVRVAEPPVDGKANEAVRRLIARELGLSVSAVQVRHGAGSRDKLLSIEHPDPAAARAALGLP